MDVTTLMEKQKTLEQQRDQAVANVHALAGAIEFCKQLIAEADALPAPSNPPQEP